MISLDAPLWQLEFGGGPLVAVALHNGHALRAEVAERMALSQSDRLREEDPGTGSWTTVAPTRIVAGRSRFEMDLNRSRARAVYRRPEDAWGLTVWHEWLPLTQDAILRTLVQYDDFYRCVEFILERLIARHGRIVILDLHSYNHRRNGPDAPPSDPAANPDVDLGTATLDRERWRSIVEQFASSLRAFEFGGRRLDVRENVRFRGGGHFSVWVRERFPESACCLSIEVKKFYMDEWTGEINQALSALIHEALACAAAEVTEIIQRP
jgi:N-formylglutamate amidohydrolase